MPSSTAVTPSAFAELRGHREHARGRDDPSVAISGIDPDNPYRYLEMRGALTSVEDDSSNTFIDSMAKKYMDVDGYPFHQPADERVVMIVTPSHFTQMG